MLWNWKQILAALMRSWTAAAIAVIAAAVHLRTVIRQTAPAIPALDFSNFYIWAWAMRHQIDPYRINLTPYADMLHIHIFPIVHSDYPPTFLLMFEPLTFIAPLPAMMLWSILTAVLLIASLFLMVRESKTTTLPAALIIISLGVFYRAVQTNYLFLQAQILILFLLVVMWLALKRGREVSAGGLLALAGLLKIYPLFMMLYLVIMRKWRTLWATLIFLAAGFALTVAILGPLSLGFYHTLLFHAQPHGGIPTAPMVGLGGAIVQLYRRFDPLETHSGLVLARYTAVGILEVGMLSISVLAIVRSKTNPLNAEYAFGFCIAAMILCYPNSWAHYMVLFLFPFCQIAIAAEAGLAPPMVTTLAVVSYLLAELSAKTAYTCYRHNEMELGQWLIEGMTISAIIAYMASYLLTTSESLSSTETRSTMHIDFPHLVQRNIR